MERNLLFICSDDEIDSFSYEEAIKSHANFSSLISYDDLFDLSRKLNGILDKQQMPEPLRKFVDIWDISDKKLILRVFGNCYYHYQNS